MIGVETKFNLKEQYLTDFQIFSEFYGKSLPAFRREAIGVFSKLGFPTTKHEEWKYTSLSALLKPTYKAANPAIPFSSIDVDKYKVAGEDAIVLVFQNGRFNKQASSPYSHKSIRIKSLAESPDIQLNNHHFGALASANDEAFVALNTAFHFDGVFICLPDNTDLKTPVHIIHVNDSRNESIAAYPRNLIIVGKNSKAQIISSYHSLNQGNASLTNSVTEIFVGENAFVEVDYKQNEGDTAYHINQTFVKQQRNSTFDICTATVGGKLIRNNLNIVLSDVNCTAHLNGLAISVGNQIIDNHTLVDHASPNCQSNELYKNILDGNSHGIFNGKIYVRKDAQKTNAYQSNKNILLSKEAVMNAKPQLEIYADDVKCSHGATTGQLDDDALFYLRARGIGEADAKALLNFAFASDVIEKINNESLKKNLLQLLAKKLNSDITFDLE